MVNHLDISAHSDLEDRDNPEESNDPELVEGPLHAHWFVYICRSRFNHYYVGMSPNPLKRLKKHNRGNGSKMANDQGGFTLVYVSQPYEDKSSARKRELQIKKWSRTKKEKLINGIWK